MKEVINQIEQKLDQIDSEKEELEDKLEFKRFQLKKVNSLIAKLEDLQKKQQN